MHLCSPFPPLPPDHPQPQAPPEERLHFPDSLPQALTAKALRANSEANLTSITRWILNGTTTTARCSHQKQMKVQQSEVSNHPDWSPPEPVSLNNGGLLLLQGCCSMHN